MYNYTDSERAQMNINIFSVSVFFICAELSNPQIKHLHPINQRFINLQTSHISSRRLLVIDFARNVLRYTGAMPTMSVCILHCALISFPGTLMVKSLLKGWVQGRGDDRLLIVGLTE